MYNFFKKHKYLKRIALIVLTPIVAIFYGVKEFAVTFSEVIVDSFKEW